MSHCVATIIRYPLNACTPPIYSQPQLQDNFSCQSFWPTGSLCPIYQGVPTRSLAKHFIAFDCIVQADSSYPLSPAKSPGHQVGTEQFDRAPTSLKHWKTRALRMGLVCDFLKGALRPCRAVDSYSGSCCSCLIAWTAWCRHVCCNLCASKASTALSQRITLKCISRLKLLARHSFEFHPKMVQVYHFDIQKKIVSYNKSLQIQWTTVSNSSVLLIKTMVLVWQGIAAPILIFHSSSDSFVYWFFHLIRFISFDVIFLAFQQSFAYSWMFFTTSISHCFGISQIVLFETSARRSRTLYTVYC